MKTQTYFPWQASSPKRSWKRAASRDGTLKHVPDVPAALPSTVSRYRDSSRQHVRKRKRGTIVY